MKLRLQALSLGIVLVQSIGYGSTAAQALRLLDMKLRFEPDRGDPSRYVARGRDFALSLGTGGSELSLRDGKGRESRVSTRFVGSSAVAVEPLEPLAGRVNYVKGNDPASWRTNVATFGRVRYRELYPGIDLVFYGADGLLEYDFVVGPGADPSLIRLRVEGARRLRIVEGDLVLETEVGQVRWRRPTIYQTNGPKRLAIAGRFIAHGREVRFEVGRYDRKKPLVIDPTLSYSTYVGGSASEGARGIGVDAAGNIYIAGVTRSPNLRTSAASFQSAFGGRGRNDVGDGFVAKITAAGALSYLTYLGGSDDDLAMAIAVDAAGSAYVTGMTISTNFPTTPGAFQTTFKGRGGNTYGSGGDAFVTKLNPNGGVVYSTFLGGARDDGADAIAIDSDGNAYVAGGTLSTDFPVTPGVYQNTNRGFGGQPDVFVGRTDNVIRLGDVFVAKVNPSGSGLVFATLLGGTLDDAPAAIAIDSARNVYVAGGTLSANFPTTAGAYQPAFKGVTSAATRTFILLGDGFVSKLNPTGTALLYSTLLGGTSGDAITALAVDSAGAMYVAGLTSSSDFPTSASGYQRTYKGPAFAQKEQFISGDAFVAKFEATGTLAYSTYLGGANDDGAMAIAVDPSGSAIIAGGTASRDFPTTTDATQRNFGGSGSHFTEVGDGFIAKLSANGSSLTYSSYLGGSADDAVGGMVIDPQGNAYLTGNTSATNFPVTAGATQGTHASTADDESFVAKISGVFTPAGPGPGPGPGPGSGLTLSEVSNAASYAANAVSPGEIIFVKAVGSGPKELLTAQVDPGTGRLSTTLAGVQLLFDGTPAPLVYVAENQLSGIVPYNVTGKQTTQAQVLANGVRSTTLTLQVTSAVPGLFSANSSGTGQGAILNQDNSFNSAANPASENDVIVLFGSGEGQTVPGGVDGKLATEVFPKPALPVSVTIGGQPAEIAYVGAAPLFTAGLLQINVRIPAGVGPGDKAVVVRVGSADSQAGLTVAVK